MQLRRFVFAFFCFCQLGICQGQADETKTWNEFVGWLKNQPAVAWEVLIPEYKPHLIASGLSEAKAAEYLSIVEKLAKERRLDLTAIDFDKYYLNNTSSFSKEPNAFLATVISGFKPGRALEVAMGQGRNSVFLAEKGWDVTGFDIATEGPRLAREKAEKLGSKITTVRATHEAFDYGRNQWDLVVMTYSWAPMNKREYIQRIYDSLKTGGIVLVEDNTGSLGSKQVGDNFLFKWFEGFRILRYEAEGTGSEWGNPKDSVYRLLAQKPQAGAPKQA
jgi:SAM-dependent methyltransferase